jgi:hypothetical protein
MKKEAEAYLPGNTGVGNIRVAGGEREGPAVAAEGSYFLARMYAGPGWDWREHDKLLKCVEREVRDSEEYAHYIAYLKGEVGLRRCAVLGNIGDDKAEVEFHHYPFTLYDICQVAVAAMLLDGEPVTSFLTSERVLSLHYENLIGVVPLCKTVHELVHAGRIFVSLRQVFGDVAAFVERFRSSIPNPLMERLEELSGMTEAGAPHDPTGVLSARTLRGGEKR